MSNENVIATATISLPEQQEGSTNLSPHEEGLACAGGCIDAAKVHLVNGMRTLRHCKSIAPEGSELKESLDELLVYIVSAHSTLVDAAEYVLNALKTQEN